jgi:monofunctional biosynthetic peptidoglycan transglycosylase
MFIKFLKKLLRIGLIILFSNILFIIIFRFLPIPTSSFMLQQRISNLFSEEKSSVLYDWVPDYKISNSAKLAAIAAEDQKFFDHFGFDVESITKAIEQNKNSRRVRGASTITQQTAKNLFLWPGKSFIRKGLEAYFTVLLELFWSKERILEVYLNIAEFGENVYGVQAASQKFFKKDANKLSYHNSASLASVLPNPKRYKVNSPTQYLARRIQWIERQMYQLGEKTITDN